MKNLLFGLSAFFAYLFAAANISLYAQTKTESPPSAQPPAAKFQYLEITIHTLNVWPIKESGHCWDPPCFGKKYKLPHRGADHFEKYFDDPNFRKVCSAPVAPDPFVEIKIGKYEKFVTDKINNTCNPTFNLKHVFRITPDDAFTISVYDNDGMAGVQIKRELIGSYTANTIPPQLINDGRLVLRSFGQVEELVLTARIVERKVSPSCEGVYRLRIAEFSVQPTKASGQPWDRGVGKMQWPDVVVKLKIGNSSIKTPQQDDTLATIFTDVSSVITIKQGMTVSLKVIDVDYFGKYEMIGETAMTDACQLLNPEGIYSFKNFDRVNKVVIIIEKLQ